MVSIFPIIAIATVSSLISCQALNTVTECFDDNDCARGDICNNGVCQSGNAGTDTESTSQSDADTDADMDSNNDTHSDGDVDGDTDTDAAPDTDSAADADIDGDTDTDAAPDTDSAADADIDGDTDTDAAPDTDSAADADADGDTDTDAAPDTDSAADADIDGDTDADTDADSAGDTECHPVPADTEVRVMPDAEGFLDRSTNALSMQGEWYTTGCEGAAVTPAAGETVTRTADGICFRGTVPTAVDLDSDNLIDWQRIWGAVIGFNVCEDNSTFYELNACPFSPALADQVVGVRMNFTGEVEPLLNKVRIAFQETGWNESAYLEVESFPGEFHGLFADATVGYQSAIDARSLNVNNLYSIQVYIPSNSTGAVNFDFCITDIQMILADGVTLPNSCPTDLDTDTDTDSDSDTTPLPECTQDADCTLHDDCCACTPLGVGEAAPECTVTECDASACSVLSEAHSSIGPVCRAGRCVLDISCNADQVDCNTPAPVCADGLVPSVNDTGDCWSGECLLPEACSEVTNCGQCPDDLYCVQSLAWVYSYNCVDIPSECADDLTCDCLGDNFCTGPGFVCVDGEGTSSPGCTCPSC